MIKDKGHMRIRVRSYKSTENGVQNGVSGWILYARRVIAGLAGIGSVLGWNITQNRGAVECLVPIIPPGVMKVVDEPSTCSIVWYLGSFATPSQILDV